MNNRKMSDLRNHLFDVIESLKTPNSKEDLNKAQVIINASQAIISSVKVENDYLKIMERAGDKPAYSSFIDVGIDKPVFELKARENIVPVALQLTEEEEEENDRLIEKYKRELEAKKIKKEKTAGPAKEVKPKVKSSAKDIITTAKPVVKDPKIDNSQNPEVFKPNATKWNENTVVTMPSGQVVKAVTHEIRKGMRLYGPPANHPDYPAWYESKLQWLKRLNHKLTDDEESYLTNFKFNELN